MAKALKAAVVAALVIFVVVATGGMLAPTLFAGMSAGAMAAMTFATTLLTGLIAGTPKGMDAFRDNFGTKTTTRSPTAPRQILYGTSRVGGIVLHMETSGTDNNKLHMIVGLAGHEVNSLVSVRFNDNDLSTSSSTVSGETVHTVTNSDYTNTENEHDFGSGRLARFTFHDGSQTAADGLASASLNSITANHKFKGIAYVYLELIFDPEAFGGGIPQITYLVKGKDVFDPRTGAIGTSDLQRSNPALIIRDYLTNTTYGLKATTAEINDTTNAGGFAAAANTCDQNVNLASGTERRYTANGFTNYSADGEKVINGILSAMAGKVSYVNGQFNIFAGATQTPSLTITDDELLAPLAIQTNSSGGELYNQVKAIYVDSTQNYTGTDAPLYSDSTFLGRDTPSGAATANYAKLLEVQLPFTVTSTMAQRISRIYLNHHRQTIQLSASVSTAFMRCQPNDWVYLTNERMGWTNKVFEVLSTNLEQVGDESAPIVATRLQLKEVDGSVWDMASNAYTTDQATGSDVSIGTYAVTAPSNPSRSQVTVKDAVDRKININVAWVNNTSPMVVSTEIAYKISSDSNFSAITVGKGVTRADIPNVAVGKTYNIKVRHIDLNGVTSTYTAASNIAITAPSDAPSNPSSASVTTGKPFNILITYNNPNNSDLKAVKIYRKTANSTPNANDTDGLVHTQYGSPSQKSTWMDGKVNGLTAGTTYYYWLRAVNHSDVNSAFVAVGGGNFTEVALADTTGIVNNIDRAQFYIVQKSTTAAPTTAESNAAIGRGFQAGDTCIVEKTSGDAASKAYKRNSTNSSWTEITNLISGDMVIDGTIGADQIVATGLSADVISTGTLNVNRIPSSVVFTNELDGTNGVTQIGINGVAYKNQLDGTTGVTQTTISGGNITTGSISANRISGGTIDASSINVENLSATNINSGNLNANRLTLNGSTLTITNNGLQIGGAVPINLHAGANSLGVAVGATGQHNLGTTNWNTGSSSFHNPQLLGGSPLTVTVAQTASAVTKTYLLFLSINAVGTDFGSSAISAGIGYNSSAQYTSAGAMNASPFFVSGAQTAFRNGYANLVSGSNTIAVGLNMSVTTSTSASQTFYIYPWGGLYRIANPQLQFSVQVIGLHR